MPAAIEIREAEPINRCAENQPATALLAEAETSMQSEAKIAIADATEIEPAIEDETESEAAVMVTKAEKKAPEVETEKEEVAEAEVATEREAEMVTAGEIPDLREGESEVRHGGNSANTANRVRERNKW